MSNDLISIIVPVYNTGDLLIGCLDSLLKQDYSPIEIILVDDGSTDKRTLALCEQYQKSHNQIKVIHQSNGGPSKARNTGIENASGKYIGFVDSDDYVDKDAYSNLHQMAVRYEVPLVLGEMRIDGARQLLSGSGLKDGKHSQKEILSKFMLGSWHSACTNLYSKSLIEDIRFPLNEINEDYIFNFEVLLKANQIAVYNNPFYHYIKQEYSRTGAPASLRHLDWLKHTEYVKNRVNEQLGNVLQKEAAYQHLFANIILANKCLLSIAKGYTEEPTELFKITVNNLKGNKREIFHNPFLSIRLRTFAIALSTIPHFYKSLILTILKLKK